MLNDGDPGPHGCVVQSDRRILKYVLGVWVAVCLREQENVLKLLFF